MDKITQPGAAAFNLLVLLLTIGLTSAMDLRPVTAANPKSQTSTQHSAVSQPRSSTTTPVLRLGSRGAAVKQLQTTLKTGGYYTGQADGAFGPQTQAAVIKFQRAKRLTADGVVGAKTWAALRG